MKKKLKQSEEALPGQPSDDYVVGQVSGSLFQKNSAASGSSLLALFSTAAPAAPVLFQPAPPPVQKSAEAKEAREKEGAEVKGQQEQKKKKTVKEKSEAEEKLETWESSLQNADEDERGHETASSEKKKNRKRKAAEAGEEKDVEQWVMKRQKKRERKQEDAVKTKRTVFVGNLPVGCTKKTLQSLFREDGSIESIRFRSVVREDPSVSRKVAVIQRKVHPKKQSINAYVVFKDEEGVAKALERNGLEIEKDFHIRVDRVSASAAHDHKRSVFVGNLSFEINELSVRRHFEQCGAVEAVRLVRDQNSGLGKGFGYVLFESADSVQLALELDSSKLEGRSVRVKRSVKKEKLKKSDGPVKGSLKGPGRERGGGRGGGGGGRGGFRSFSGNRQKSSSGSFKGEMTNPNKKMKKKPKVKPRKKVHI